MKKNKGFTTVELLIALVLGGVVVGSILTLSITSQKISNSIIEQSRVSDYGKKVVEMVSRDIRGAARVELYVSYPASGSTVTSGNYLQIFFPVDQGLANVGYYFSTAEEKIYKVVDLATDNTGSSADDKLIAEGVDVTTIFTIISNLLVKIDVRIVNMIGVDANIQSADFSTQVSLRN